MKKVNQEDWNDCAPACLAMVTELPIERVKEMVGVPTTHAEMHGFLLRHNDGVRAITIVEDMTVRELRTRPGLFSGEKLFNERRLILTVASPNPRIDWHAVVVNEGELCDPHGYWTSLDDILDVTCTWGFDVDP